MTDNEVIHAPHDWLEQVKARDAADKINFGIFSAGGKQRINDRHNLLRLVEYAGHSRGCCADLPMPGPVNVAHPPKPKNYPCGCGYSSLIRELNDE